MKKLMIVAAVASACIANAAQKLTDCTVASGPCDSIVFKLTASGKVAADMDTYKSVKSLKVSKGYIVLNSESATDACCYDYVTLLAQVKVQKRTYKLAILDEANLVWTVFGKNLDKAMNDLDAGKSTSLETELGFAAGNNFVGGAGTIAQFDDNADISSAFDMIATGFGTMKYGLSKSNNSKCSPNTPCEPILTWKSYKGYFAGIFGEINSEALCATCSCPAYDLFGGTWSASYQKKLKSTAAVAKAVFGASYEDADGEWEVPEE